MSQEAVQPNPVHAIMHPRSVVVAGASNNFMKMGAIQALNLLNSTFAGEVFFYHPKDKIVLGRPAYADPAAFPTVPDLALLVTPTRVTPRVLDELGAVGLRYAVIVTAGFREMGPEGAKLEQELLAVAARHGIRFIGPNCIGILNAHNGLNLTVAPYRQAPGHLGLISQSGTYVAQTIPLLHERGIRYSQALSVGNASNIDEVDCLDYLGDDPDTKAIIMYIEGIRRGRKFIEVARRVTRRKPVVALYVGGSASGARSGLSHTGSLGGPDVLYNGIFEQAGVMRAATVTEMFDWGHALANMPAPRGRRMAIITHSGGPATSMADTCEKLGLTIPELSEELQAMIRPHIEPTASAKNPVDLTFTMESDGFIQHIPEMLFASDEVDGVLMHGVMDTGFADMFFDHIKKLVAIDHETLLSTLKMDLSKLLALPQQYGKPLVASTFLFTTDHAAQTFRANSTPLYTSPEAAVKAMAALARSGEIRQRPVNDFATDITDHPGPPLPTGVMDEFAAKRLLAEYGVPITDEELTYSREETLAAAQRLGYPVVLKGLPPNVAHKTEAGLVHLGLADASALQRAWEAIEVVAPGCPRLVARMMKGQRELVVGMTRFAGFGPCVMLGIGGVFTEAIKDVSFRCAPVDDHDAVTMPDSLRLKNLFGELRGLPAVDRKALVQIIQAVGRLALAHPEIAEIDINPLIVVKGRPVAVDALIVVK
ncbi:MAG TPA: acetate--CoA ligase family protein [bacterium]|nr:acetate--CoA ligase family protein [bacterium]